MDLRCYREPHRPWQHFIQCTPYGSTVVLDKPMQDGNRRPHHAVNPAILHYFQLPKRVARRRRPWLNNQSSSFQLRSTNLRPAARAMPIGEDLPSNSAVVSTPGPLERAVDGRLAGNLSSRQLGECSSHGFPSFNSLKPADPGCRFVWLVQQSNPSGFELE